MKRKEILERLHGEQVFDVLVVGGGATGLGVALDAISRGFRVALVERVDFGKGTSSKATKLLHGGVRYLQNGDVGLVIEALQEREFVLKQAPHLSRVQQFVIPHYSYWRGWYYWIGLKMYDILSGRRSLGKTVKLSKDETLESLPNLKQEGLKGGIRYTDGQFDDTRLCIDLVSKINESKGVAINYCGLESFTYGDDGQINGGILTDELTGATLEIKARSVVNATGVFAEETMAKESADTDIKIVPARGSHIVLDRSFLASDDAIMIPKTSDGRVLFLVPWHNVVIAGTTDVVSPELTMEPSATDQEIDFILNNAAQYLSTKPNRADILSTFAGLRPLAAPKREGKKSKEISRSHKIVVSKKGLVSVLGGKWTTFRRMGQDAIDKIIKSGKLPKSETRSEHIQIDDGALELKGKPVHEKLPYSWQQLQHAIDTELVEYAEDLLCRRTRCILLHKQGTMAIADLAIKMIADARGHNEQWQSEERVRFDKIAEAY